MTYQVRHDKRVMKDLDGVPKKDVERIKELFKQMEETPVMHGTEKLSGGSGMYRIRQGDYRILYTVDHERKEVRVFKVRDRKEVYRDL